MSSPHGSMHAYQNAEQGGWAPPTVRSGYIVGITIPWFSAPPSFIGRHGIGGSCAHWPHYGIDVDWHHRQRHVTWCHVHSVVLLFSGLPDGSLVYEVSVYHYLVSNYNNPPALEDLVWSVLLEALFTGMTGFLVQFFFTIRVWRLSKSFLLTGIILLIVVANAGCGTAWVIISMQMRTYIDLLTISPLTISINALSAGGDVLIAGSLVVLLRRARTGFKKSDTTINRLIVFIVNTGVLTSCIAIAALISITASPKTLIYASFYFCIGRFYANSLLATLNARKHIAGWNDDASHMLVSMPPSVVNSSGGKVQPNISIRIETTQRCDGLEAQSHQGHDKSCDGLSKQKAPALEAWH